MTNEEAAIKIAEELAVKEANAVSLLARKEVILDFLDYCVNEGELHSKDKRILEGCLDDYLK